MKIDQVLEREVWIRMLRVKKTQLLITRLHGHSSNRVSQVIMHESWSFVRVSGPKSFNCITFQFASSSVCFPVVITSTIKL